MAVLPQRPPTLTPRNHAKIFTQITLTTRLHCSATVPPSPRRPLILDNPPKPRGPVLNDPSLKSSWSHRAWLATGCTTLFISLAKSAAAAIESRIWLEPIVAGLAGYVLADLGSGVVHWCVDNYGAGTPLFGAQFESAQGHHKRPWTITRRQIANNLHALARAVTFTVLPINLVCDHPTMLAFVAVCFGLLMFSQQFHAWAHTAKSRLPRLVAALQDGGVLVSWKQHAAHHRFPYNRGYCVVSGAWNEVLDRKKVFEAMEMVIFFKFGVRPRSWTEETEDASDVLSHEN